MSKKYAIFITALFCAFLGVFFVVGAVSPDKEFSEQENRMLAQMPTLELGTPAEGFQDGNLFNAEFMSDYETYVADQFPLRDGWVGMKAGAERVLGKQENNGIYFGAKDTLLVRFDKPDQSRLDKNVGYVNTLVKNSPVPVYMSLIPGSAQIWADRLPANAPSADQKAVIDSISAASDAQFFDCYQNLWDHRGEDIYYRTDHHWTSLGAYYGYVSVMNGLGMGDQVVDLKDLKKQTVSESFYGTSFSNSGVRWISPDQIDIYVPDPGVKVTSSFTSGPEEGSLYVWENLEIKDKYTFFMGGNQSLGVIENPNVDGPKLLIIRDSYTDSLVPFLTQHFSEIHLLDLRYYRSSVPQYIKENDIDMCLVLYSVNNFSTDGNLFTLGQK